MSSPLTENMLGCHPSLKPEQYRCCYRENRPDQCHLDASKYVKVGNVLKPYCVTHAAFNDIQRAHEAESKKMFESGAIASIVSERFDLICPIGWKRIAARYGLGSSKYSDFNWCQGGDDPVYIRARLNHLIKHVNEYLLNGNTGDDNLAAIAWNAIALMHFEEHCKHHELHTKFNPPTK